MTATLCGNIGTSQTPAWTLGSDSSFVFYLPDGTAQYIKMGENITVPIGTYLAFAGSISYTHWDAYAINGVSVGIQVLDHASNTAARYQFNKVDVADPGYVVKVLSGPETHATMVYQLTGSCTISAQMCAHSVELDGIAMEMPHASSIITVIQNTDNTTAPVPLSVVGVSFSTTNAPDAYTKSMPTEAQYNVFVGVKNDTNQNITQPVALFINGTRQPDKVYTWESAPIGPLTWKSIGPFTSTGNDVVCAAFDQTPYTPTGDVIGWIESHPIEVVSASAIAVFAIAYLATRGIKTNTYKRSKK